MPLPRIAITMGDPSGIGPEIIVKALARPEVHSFCRALVVGDARRLIDAQRICNIKLEVPIDVECYDLKNVPRDLAWGKLSPVAGDAAFQYIKFATDLAMKGEIDAICTAPINKAALQAAGHMYPGHTELLAAIQPELYLLSSRFPRRRVCSSTQCKLRRRESPPSETP